MRPGDAKRKGKIERPFRDLKGGVPAGDGPLDPPGDIGELNRRAGRWLASYVHPVRTASTGVAPEARLAGEAPLFGGRCPGPASTPPGAEPRVVNGPVPLVEWDAVGVFGAPRAGRPRSSRPACPSRPALSEIIARTAPSWAATVWPRSARVSARRIAPRPRPSPWAPHRRHLRLMPAAASRRADPGVGVGAGRRRLRRRPHRPGPL